ncbi:juvenile hormone epoxide hydrolase-like [Manduca sexta]|uniref:juvenile hormone epoxide hydrolase-like n=1 Tax=Manduca sexta TaxID=7130 RepID=UPI00188E0CB8|nr:juvenile hormone epoxide hydrolase-like [Manduca sexta]
MAFIMKNLMERLGYDKFYVQGGDWGGIICSIMATFFPDIILGYHTNFALVPAELVSRLYPLQFYVQEFGYFHIQAAKPDAIGLCVGKSPASIMAWFLHLFSISTGSASRDDPKGGLNMFTPEQLIDNIMLYWVPEKVTTSIRIYAETFTFRNLDMEYISAPTPVPTVVLQALREVFYFPPAALNTKFTNLVAVDVLDDYGHFLAMEAPKVFVDKVISGLQKIIDFNKNELNCTK